MPAVVNEETMEIKSPKTNENSKAKKTSSLYLDGFLGVSVVILSGDVG